MFLLASCDVKGDATSDARGAIGIKVSVYLARFGVVRTCLAVRRFREGRVPLHTLRLSRRRLRSSRELRPYVWYHRCKSLDLQRWTSGNAEGEL